MDRYLSRDRSRYRNVSTDSDAADASDRSNTRLSVRSTSSVSFRASTPALSDRHSEIDVTDIIDDGSAVKISMME